MSTITPYYRTIQQLLQNQSFAIDEYQREYKWERENIDELVTDLLGKFRDSYHVGHTTAEVPTYQEYFLGSIIVAKRNGKNFLVDGQQRVTSLTLLIIHLYRLVNETPQWASLTASLAPLIYSDNFGTPKFNLDIPERLPVLDALFNGKDFAPGDNDESLRTMVARYADIQEQDLGEALGEALPHFAYWLMTKVGLIEIATGSDEQAYAIFETMNDRGKPLSPVDMLKAYVLAPVTDDAQRRSANSLWKQQVLKLSTGQEGVEPERDANCIKAWFRSQFAESTRERKAGATDQDWEQMGTTFHRWARDNSSALKLGNAKENLEFANVHFPFFVKAYLQVLDASRTYTPGLESVFYNSHNAFTWQSTVCLAPLCHSDSVETVKKKLGATATYLDIWLMRRATNYIRVGYSHTSYAMFLLCRDIRRMSLDDLIDVLRAKLQADEVTFEGAEKKGRQGVDAFGITQFSRRYVFHLLCRLTAYVEVGAGRPDLFSQYIDRDVKNPLDIEHIWPNDYTAHQQEFSTREDFQAARNHIAGLVLLPADVNRSFQDKPFEKKSPHYMGQNLYAASLTPSAYEHQPKFKAFREKNQLQFKPYTSFGRAEQEERRELVGSLVKRVWSLDRLEAYR